LGRDSSEAPNELINSDFQDVPTQMGLHAKMILQKRGSKSVLFVGSTNLTRRGLQGPNAEILAELEISDAEVSKSLTQWFDSRPRPTLERKSEEGIEAVRTALDEDVASLGAVEFLLVLEPAGLTLSAVETFDAFLFRNNGRFAIQRERRGQSDLQPVLYNPQDRLVTFF